MQMCVLPSRVATVHRNKRASIVYIHVRVCKYTLAISIRHEHSTHLSVFFHIMQRTAKICVKRWRVKTRSALHRADDCTSTIDYIYYRSRFIATGITKTTLSLLENHELRCREGKPLR